MIRAALHDFTVGDRHLPHCWVCGRIAHTWQNPMVPDGRWRCNFHLRNNPCGVDGCTNSHRAQHSLHNQIDWVCSVHWKQVCPPRSVWRRTYLRFFRIARKLGVEKSRWPDDLERRYWRFFEGMVRRYDRRASGEVFVDEAEINRMFGWGE